MDKVPQHGKCKCEVLFRISVFHWLLIHVLIVQYIGGCMSYPLGHSTAQLMIVKEHDYSEWSNANYKNIFEDHSFKCSWQAEAKLLILRKKIRHSNYFSTFFNMNMGKHEKYRVLLTFKGLSKNTKNATWTYKATHFRL